MYASKTASFGRDSAMREGLLCLVAAQRRLLTCIDRPLKMAGDKIACLHGKTSHQEI
jgi:hypothetical protein